MIQFITDKFTFIVKLERESKGMARNKIYSPMYLSIHLRNRH